MPRAVRLEVVLMAGLSTSGSGSGILCTRKCSRDETEGGGEANSLTLIGAEGSSVMTSWRRVRRVIIS